MGAGRRVSWHGVVWRRRSLVSAWKSGCGGGPVTPATHVTLVPATVLTTA